MSPTLTAASSPMRDVAWALEEHVVWRVGDMLGRAGDAFKWPFERFAWIAEQRLLWPLQEWAADRGVPLRTAGFTVAALAAAAVAVGIVVGSDNPPSAVRQAAAAKVGFPVPTVGLKAPDKAPAGTGPVLHGVPPHFPAKTGAASTGAGAAAATGAQAPKAQSHTAALSAKPPAMEGLLPAVPDPAAIEVAHRFSKAFVVYETGETTAAVRRTFRETAIPRLASSLLRRPPRVPANVEIPRAKVINVVPGPRFGDVYTVSVSLLRVGMTSELRLDLQRETPPPGSGKSSSTAGPTKKSGDWRVTDVRG